MFQSVLDSKPAVTPDVPDKGMFNVWTEPDDDQFGEVPDVPGVPNDCDPDVIPFIDDITPELDARSVQSVELW